jgi:hypothetical protein
MRLRLLSHEYNFLRREYWFGQVDSRPLSAFRIAFALLLLKDALYHLPLAGLFYSDVGIVPRSSLLGGLARPERFSLMDALAHEWMATAFFVLWACVALALLLGYRTRLMTVLNFVLVLSIHERNVYVLTGADTAMRVLSFWIMFLPLSDYYSIDALRYPRSQQTAFALPVRLVQFQVALVYLVTGYLKLSGESWQGGEALYYVLQLESIRWPPGTWLWEVAPVWLLSLFTWLTIILELAFMPLVFAPFLQPFLRAVALLLGAALHLGIAVTMAIPDFSLVMMTSYLLLFEPSWVKWIENRLPLNRLWACAQPLPAVRWILNPLIERDALPRRHIEENQQTSTFPLLSASTETEHAFACSLESGRDRDRVKRSVYYRRLSLAFLLALLMAAVIWWNLTEVVTYTSPPAPPMPDFPEAVVWYTGLWQYWDLFAPLPLQIDGRITVPGRFEDGASFDLYAAQTARPMWGPEMRWRKFEENINNYRSDDLLREWGRYYCRLYNNIGARPEGTRLATLEIHFVYRRSHRPGGTPGPLQDDLLWNHWCYEEYRYRKTAGLSNQAFTEPAVSPRTK